MYTHIWKGLGTLTWCGSRALVPAGVQCLRPDVCADLDDRPAQHAAGTDGTAGREGQGHKQRHGCALEYTTSCRVPAIGSQWEMVQGQHQKRGVARGMTSGIGIGPRPFKHTWRTA